MDVNENLWSEKLILSKNPTQSSYPYRLTWTGIKAIIKNRSFFPIDDVREANEAIALLNREILTAPTPVSSGDETSTDTGDDTVTEPDEPTEEPEA